MMMPRKKRITILIVSITVLILAIILALGILYIKTDMFKSDAILFAKYMGQTVENLDSIYQTMDKNEYEKQLEHSQYTTKTEVKVNYTQEMGTTSENTENSINQLHLKIDGKTDKNKQYNYQNISLWKEEQKVTELEYAKKQDIYGIRFSDLYKQYVGINQEQLKELLETVGYKKEIEIEENKIELKNIFQFSEEEKQTIKTKYMDIINKNVAKEDFSKQKNQTIQIDGKNVNVNAYILTLTKEKMNNIFIQILEQIKQDEMVLARIDRLQTLIENYQGMQNVNVKEIFIEEIENRIAEITKKNIGQEEVKIIVYENYHNTVRVLIQNPEYEIIVDVVSWQAEKYMQIARQDKTMEKEQKQVITYRGTEEDTDIGLELTKNGKTTNYSLSIKKKVEGDNATKTIEIEYKDDLDKVETIVEQHFSMVSNFEEEIDFTDENMINLSQLEEPQVQAIREQVTKQVSERITEITTKDIKMQDLWHILKVIGFIKEDQTFETIGITEAEKNRFNSKFEILQGENLGNAEVLNLINAIKENLLDMEVISNTELKLKLDRFQKNEEIVTTLTTFIEKNKNRKYHTKIEYDGQTGLVSNIILILVEKK